ncbi:hypothetical protein [Bradyrhizobium nitroreducens]|uniref:hypothetical protein n=1 Tax=Bradyrhizobium nitroreducens TaxID=709803 RepID=UPI0011AEB5E1|nr:hypothetical protein [Bradyrhizobium nitroreducens]
MTDTSTSSNNACTYTRHFSLGNLPLQTCQQSSFVDAGRHRRVDRRDGRREVLERVFQHSSNMVPFGESLNRRLGPIVDRRRPRLDMPLRLLDFLSDRATGLGDQESAPLTRRRTAVRARQA